MHFDYTVFHTAGKHLVIADALSRSPVSNPSKAGDVLNQDVDAFVNLVLTHLPASKGRLTEIKAAQEQDLVCKNISYYIKNGWPDKTKIDSTLVLHR